MSDFNEQFPVTKPDRESAGTSPPKNENDPCSTGRVLTLCALVLFIGTILFFVLGIYDIQQRRPAGLEVIGDISILWLLAVVGLVASLVLSLVARSYYRKSQGDTEDGV